MIDSKLLKEITQYCEFNGITDIEREVNRLLKIGFAVDKYGTSPFDQMQKEIATIKGKVMETEFTTEQVEEKPKPKRGRKKKDENTVVEVTSLETENKKSEVADVPPKKKMRIIKNN